MVNWKARLAAAIPKVVRRDNAKPILLTDRPATDRETQELQRILDEVALMVTPTLVRLPRVRPRWNPEGFAPTMVVLVLTDGYLKGVQ